MTSAHLRAAAVDDGLAVLTAATVGVEEPPAAWPRGPNEGVDPAEIEQVALTEALFLADYPT